MVKRVAYEKKIYPSCFPCLAWRTIVLGAADGKLSSCSLFRIIRPIALNWGYSEEPQNNPKTKTRTNEMHSCLGYGSVNRIVPWDRNRLPLNVIASGKYLNPASHSLLH
jgi:hypothetical protein